MSKYQPFAMYTDAELGLLARKVAAEMHEDDLPTSLAALLLAAYVTRVNAEEAKFVFDDFSGPELDGNYVITVRWTPTVNRGDK